MPDFFEDNSRSNAPAVRGGKQKFEYKVAIYREGMLGSLFLNGSKVDPLRFSEFLNRNAADGWEVVTMEREIRRMLLFFNREAFLVVLKREV
jgi:hypothetical protein